MTFTSFSASRLGLDACLATKVGSDANGRLILQGLEEEGVDVSRVVVSDATPSAFTYVIVDKEGGTRTCLHTPQTEGVRRMVEGISSLWSFFLTLLKLNTLSQLSRIAWVVERFCRTVEGGGHRCFFVGVSLLIYIGK